MNIKGKKAFIMYKMNYDLAAEHWIKKDQTSIHMNNEDLKEKIDAFIKEQPHLLAW